MRLLIPLILLAACSSKATTYVWGTVTEVDKDHKIIRQSFWHYTVKLDDERIVSGKARNIIKVGWRVKFDGYGRIVEVREVTIK